MSAISIVNAKKNYNTLWALKGINLQVSQGEFFGLLGPNGAGKTTLISSIVGLCHLTEGSIAISDLDIRKESMKAHALVGFAPQDVNLDRFFPIRKLLMFQAGFFGFKKKQQAEIVDQLLVQFHLEEKADSPYYKLSGGMQRRLLVAKAMVGLPKVLILDEPTAGIDVEQRHELWEYLRNLNRNGTTILLTTHYIDEAEALCERIGIINLGLIRELGTPKDLINKYCEKKVTVELSHNVTIKNGNVGTFELIPQEKKLICRGQDVGVMMDKIQEVLAQNPGCRIVDLYVERGTLEDVFLKVTGRSIAEKEDK